MTHNTAHLVQLILPLRDNTGRPFPNALWEQLKQELAERFGGVTAYTQAPAEGVWNMGRDGHQREEVFVVEVMTPGLDAVWWRDLRHKLEHTLRQEDLVIRATPFLRL